VEDGIIRFLTGQDRVKELEKAVEAAMRAAKIAQVQYKAGTVDFNRVSLLQEKLYDRQISLANARREIASGLVQTYKALGGGWQIRLDGCAPTPIIAGASDNGPTDLPKPRREELPGQPNPAAGN
jgi:outer membrane protein TolC